MGIALTVVGCSGSYAGPDGAASSYLLEAEDADGRIWRVLVDLGSGALGPLQRFADPLDVDAVFLSHLHPDHFFDISGFYVLRRYHPAGPQPRIPVWGPAGVAERCATAYGLPQVPGMTEEFDFREYDCGHAIEFGPFRVTASRVDHPVEAYGLRFESGGRSVVYSGDTGPCDGLIDLAQDADVLLAEASFRDCDDNPGHLHLTGSQAGLIAKQAGVGRLVLTHVPPWHEKLDRLHEAQGTFDGQIELAEPGATYTA